LRSFCNSMKIYVPTAFPDLFSAPFTASIVKRAQEQSTVQIELIDLRDFAGNKHKQVDDYPYGGGAGMVLKPEPFFEAVDKIREEAPKIDRIILTTPQGRKYTQATAKELTQDEYLVFLCGHYKGVDERVREYLATDEISIGDYILTGGELAAMAIVDSVVRLLPGVIGDIDSALTDSFENNRLDCPYYTRPEEFRGMRVPEVLLSGHHGKINAWRSAQALARTQERRSDLLQ